MGTLTDSVLILVSSHSHNADGTSRNDVFSYTTTLANYAVDLVTYATPLYNQVVNERSDKGSAVGTFTGEPYRGGTPASTSCDLRASIQVATNSTATPTKYYLVRQELLSDYQITSATSVYNWLQTILNNYKSVTLYAGGVNFP